MINPPKTIFVPTLGKTIPVTVGGNPSKPPLLVVSPAELFKKENYLPKYITDNYCIYYADILAPAQNSDGKTADYTKFKSMKPFTKAVDEVRTALGFEKMTVFAHSALGALEVAYLKQYPDKVSRGFIMATPPYWENKKLNKLMRDFLAANHPQRLAQFDKDQKAFLALRKSWAGKDPMKRFILAYKYRRAMFFRNPNQFPVEQMYEGVDIDVVLVEQYYRVLMKYTNYNIFDEMLSDDFPDKTPIAVCMGMHDSLVPCDIWGDFLNGAHQAGKLTNVKYYISDKTGHMVTIDEEKSFANSPAYSHCNASFFQQAQHKPILLQNEQVDQFIASCHHCTPSML